MQVRCCRPANIDEGGGQEVKLYCDNGDGKLVEIATVKVIGAGGIVIRVDSIFHEDRLTEMGKICRKSLNGK